MTDYFELLEQPRAAWLDPEQLKNAFHKRTLQSHPDAQGDEAQFAQLNEAYQMLRDPKRRLQHLFALGGKPSPTNSTHVPPEIAELFPRIASLTTRAATALEKTRNATSALSRSLVRQELFETQRATEEMISLIEQRLVSANEQLRDETADLYDVFLRFSYLTRWLSELKEIQIQLTL